MGSFIAPKIEGLYSNGNGLLLRSVVGDCDYGVCGDYNATGVQHTEVTDLGASYRHFLTVTVMMVLSASIWVIHTGDKSGGRATINDK